MRAQSRLQAAQTLPAADRILRLPTLIALLGSGLLGSVWLGCSGNSQGQRNASIQPTAVLVEVDEALSDGRALPDETLRRLLAIQSDNTDVLMWLAETAHSLGQKLYREDQQQLAIELFIKAGDALRQAESTGQILLSDQRNMRGSIYYDEACALSLDGRAADALAPLRRAVEVGYGDIGLFDADSDLDAVRALPQFPAFHAELLKSQTNKIRQKVREFTPFPLQFEFTDLAGRAWNLDNLKGKVVVLDLWATWCGPCMQTIPTLVELHNDTREQGLEMIGLAFERDAPAVSIAKIKAVRDRMKINYPLALGDQEFASQIPNFRSLPTMVFIDRAGQARYQVSGAHSREYLLAILEPLLAESVEQ